MVKKKVGRPSKRGTIDLKKVKLFAEKGLTDEQLAAVLGISRETVDSYKKGWPEFSDTLKKARTLSDGKVVKSLYKRALGYEYDEVTVEGVLIGDKEINRTKKKTTTKEVVPDVTACIFWLKNRIPAEWRDKHETSIPELEGIGKALAEAVRRAHEHD